MKNLYLTLLFSVLIQPILLAQTESKYPRGIAQGTDESYETIPEKAPLTRSFFVGLPDRYTLKQYAPTPQHQGNYNTCTGWAFAYAARTILEAQKNNWRNQHIIDANAFSPTFQYRLAEPTKRDCKGAYPSEVMLTLQEYGALPIKDFQVADGKIDCPNPPLTPSNYTQAAAHKIQEVARLWTSNFSDADAKIKRVQKSLAEGNPVVISMICPPSFDNVRKDGWWEVTESQSDVRRELSPLRHSLCVVGYDKYKFGGAFEVQNSWGTDWGNKGYAWIAYEDFARFTYQAFELVHLVASESGGAYLAGSLEFYDMDKHRNMKLTFKQNKRGKAMLPTYEVRTPLKSGSKMRMYLKSEQPAYVYLLGTGSVDQSVKVLFPFKGWSAAMNYSQYEVALPSENYYLKMDNTAGKDYILVLYAKEKLNIEDIRERLALTSGSIYDRLNAGLKSIRIEDSGIDFSKNKLEFKAIEQITEKKALAVLIEFEHL